ncbi:MAG: hypothetical protein JXB49_06205 [Bacteroidales bacterium]|nr:hypothetical protein [Bacteroidales bacterium]
MGKYAIKILIFIFPFIALLVEPLLCLSTFTFRPFEALSYFHDGIGMPYYPNHKLNMISEGDLCPYTTHSVKKEEFWITDEIGYRNNHFIEDPDVVLIGDSFLLGTGITQDSTLTNLLNSKFSNKLKFYSLAPGSLNDLKVFMENGIIKKPNLIIFSLGEREIPKPFNPSKNDILYKSSTVYMLKNKITRLYAINYIRSFLFNKRAIGVQSDINDKMFFLNGKDQKSNLDSLSTVVSVIETYRCFCDSLGISFLFLPCPNKETVYYDKVPLSKQPDYLSTLDTELRGRDIATINTLRTMNIFRQKSDNLLYHLDDTHWNSNGINIIAEEIVKEISTNPQLGISSKIGL